MPDTEEQVPQHRSALQLLPLTYSKAMKRILKYQLPVQPGALSIPVMGTAAKPLSVGLQFGEPVLWAEAEVASSQQHEIKIYAVMTGQEPPEGRYLGTTLYDHGRFVLHYYEV